MPGQSKHIDELLRDRVSVVHEITAAAAEQHRLLQTSFGEDFYSLKSEVVEGETNTRETTKSKLEDIAAVLDELHSRLALIDVAIEQEGKKGKTP